MSIEGRYARQAIENLLREDRTFEPSPEFRAAALLNDASIYERTASEEGFRAFWTEEGNRLDWIEPWTDLYTWEAPYAKWFIGGKLNVSANCLDRHVAAGLGDRVAYHWEGEPGDTRTITYQELLDEVCRFTNALRGLGVKKGDRVAIYMPMIPELPVAMLACTRIGAPHSVVFGGFSADALADRIDDASCTVVITADGGYRKGATVPLKKSADDAIGRTSSVQHCVVVKRTGDSVDWDESRDHWYHDLIADQPTTADPEPMDSEDLLYLLYTSGTTAKPKGIMHTTGGYLAGVSRDASVHLRPQARVRRVLVHGRHRLGDRPLVHRVRTAREWRDRDHLRGSHRLPGQGPMGPDRGEVPRHHPLHRSDRHPRAHEVRRRCVRR